MNGEKAAATGCAAAGAAVAPRPNTGLAEGLEAPNPTNGFDAGVVVGLVVLGVALPNPNPPAGATVPLGDATLAKIFDGAAGAS